MRWLPNISFYQSNSSSTLKCYTPFFSSPVDDAGHPKKKTGDGTRRTAGGRGTSGWLWGVGKKSSRAKKLRPIGEHDGKSPPRSWQDLEDDNLMPSTSTSSYDRTYLTPSSSSSSSSVAPQPLPLPEPLLRQKDGDCPLPSPEYVHAPTTTTASNRPIVALDGITPGFRMRSVFAVQDTRRNMEQSSRVVNQDLRGSENARDNSRSAPTSPFASPKTVGSQKVGTGDFVPYHYVRPQGNQFWSAPEMPVSEVSAWQTPPAFFDLTALGPDNSPHHSSPGLSPLPNPRSPSIPSSPIDPRLSLEVRRDNNGPVNVHPLPLPPGVGLPSPSHNYSQALPKSDSLPLKSQWQKGKLIGRGTFGSVYVATNRETGALCAMKEAELFPDDPKSAECIRQLEQEIKLLSQLKHPNIVQYYGSEIVDDRFYIYLEYVHPGSINKYVREHCGAMTESVVRNFTRHILSGLAYLHSKKTIHRDIKGANLLVDSAGVVKLADFGMAKHLTGHAADLSLKGSPYWMAPELMQAVMQKDNSSDLALAVDIWSLGCTIIEMLTGKPPWSEYEGAAAMFKVMRDTPPIPETLSSEGRDFLRCCFTRNPAERATAAALLEHQFLRNSQQIDVPSSAQPFSAMTSMDKPPSSTPRGNLENKPDQLPIHSVQIAKVKANDSGIAPLSSLYP
ncbi:hypothetical protein L6164_027796 [Bauhinia variegata]|uniref:Uncharacterized protein n=1 Tax=Bauhinia variegata TaxID=167791 RepID=A0ACB9LUG6_BAUVA|nr:hypothetical protein L6164_027796 [Bauhinia variegata]